MSASEFIWQCGRRTAKSQISHFVVLMRHQRIVGAYALTGLVMRLSDVNLHVLLSQEGGWLWGAPICGLSHLSHQRAVQ